MLEDLITFISGLDALGLALIAAVLAFSETAIGLDVIVPGEAGMVVAGAAARQGDHPLWALALTVSVGATLGDCVSYVVGRRWGMRVLKRFTWTRRHTVPVVERGRDWFERRGGRAVFLGRWIGALRAVVPLVAGMERMPFGRFLAWNVAASLSWATAAVTVGYLFGLPAARALDRVGPWVYGTVALVVIVVVVVRMRRHHAPAASSS